MTPEEREQLESELRALKSNLFTPVESVADFKTIKNVEVYLTLLTHEQKAQLPYNPDEVHAEREAIREQIREIQKELDDDPDRIADDTVTTE